MIKNYFFYLRRKINKKIQVYKVHLNHLFIMHNFLNLYFNQIKVFWKINTFVT